jgi:hypothetical protein
MSLLALVTPRSQCVAEPHGHSIIGQRNSACFQGYMLNHGAEAFVRINEAGDRATIFSFPIFLSAEKTKQIEPAQRE